MKGPRTLVTDTPLKKQLVKQEFLGESPDPLMLREKFAWSPVGHAEDNDEDEELLSGPQPQGTQVLVADTPVKKRIL
jgi:hypothetical protein